MSVEGMHKSDRGFIQGTEIESGYGGFIKVYESSAASHPHIWVRIVCPVNMNNPEGEMMDATSHLTIENAEELIDQLQYLIDNHYQT